MATDGSKVQGGETIRIDDLVRQIEDWAENAATERKVLARRKQSGLLRREERIVMMAARLCQDNGSISIITRNRDGVTTFYAERALK